MAPVHTDDERHEQLNGEEKKIDVHPNAGITRIILHPTGQPGATWWSDQKLVRS